MMTEGVKTGVREIVYSPVIHGNLWRVKAIAAVIPTNSARAIVRQERS
jgi:hypothetical protein